MFLTVLKVQPFGLFSDVEAWLHGQLSGAALGRRQMARPFVRQI
jgi:hypothetical protein